VPLRELVIPQPCSNAEYEAVMRGLLEEARAAGVSRMAFGDLFLADVRAYRERMLEGTGVTPLFPLFGRDTAALAREMVDAGLRARITCVDPRRAPRGLAGRVFDARLLAELPEGVDPCGENGEFHTFVTHGPMFGAPVEVVPGGVVERDGFVFADLVPGAAAAGAPAGPGSEAP
jgi:diphthamide synthase (EF-2-diphthine--ammonia ligase)